jgi:hypothetical protein
LQRSSVHFQFLFALGHRRFAYREQEIEQRDKPIFAFLSSICTQALSAGQKADKR